MKRLAGTALLATVGIGTALAAAAQLDVSVGPNGLVGQAEKDGGQCVVWKTKVGQEVRLKDLRVILTDSQSREKWLVRLEPADRKVQRSSASLEYRVTLDDKQHPITGSARLEATVSDKAGEDVLLCRSELKFDQPVGVDVTLEYAYELLGPAPSSVFMPGRSGEVLTEPLQPNTATSGKFMLGLGSGDAAGRDLGMPVVGFCWDNAEGGSKPLQLAVAVDPYCGCSISGAAIAGQAKPLTRILVSTTYKGSLVPLISEKRTISLEFHRNGVDGSFRSVYRTISNIKPGSEWTQGIHLVYYDYLSEKGDGWFKNLQALADKIPPKHRGRVAVCLHGWYDYFQQYAYDFQQKKLMQQWVAFPGTYKVPMSLDGIHKRLKFAKDLGFRVLLYYSDGTNSDSGAPNFRKEYLLKDKNGNTFPGWKGPDSLGQPLMMDPSVSGLRDWYRGYLTSLLDEYSKDIDGFVWDETFYIPTNFISYPQDRQPTYADRAMMSLVSELTQIVQRYHRVNDQLVFLVSDLGRTSYALVAHGTWQDSACDPNEWGPSMFSNYRNCLWSCNWFPVSESQRNRIAAEQYGLPQGVSDGWGDNCGPSRMSPEVFDAMLKRFTENVESQRQRLRCISR